MPAPLFSHRHCVALAEALHATLSGRCVVAGKRLSDVSRAAIVADFADELIGTNSRFDRDRFIAAAMGEPTTGRDEPKRN